MSQKISEILPFLFIGSYQDSLNTTELTALGITHILNVRESSQFYEDKNFRRLHVAVSDFGETALTAVLDKCCKFIEDARTSGGKVLLHCARGQNRSPSVGTGYLMRVQGLRLKEAFEHMRSKRPQFAPHQSYFQQLQAIELQLFGSISLTEEQEPLSVQEIVRQVARDIKQKK